MGFSVAKDAAKVRQQIAYISVLGGNYGTLTATENLRLAAKLYGQSGADIEQRLAQVGLTEAKDRLARSFSSGMKKRLALARLLLADAPVWLLDEPYAALDEAGKELIDSLLLSAKANATTIVMASHDIARSQRHADGVLLLEQGTLRRV
jgi:heme exporter protein A